MSPAKDLEPFSDSVDDMFRRLGLPHPAVMAIMSNEWDSLTGAPWSGRSKPLYIKGTTLVIEASSASMIAFLKYGEATLLKTLADRFGEDVVKSLDIRPPGYL
ncbi:MAG TPA: DUF721 domain-containing protein [Acidimicrobiia bacterium]|nr:DUF721 domain-containing protein [Acidimicrobiia bacterium]